MSHRRRSQRPRWETYARTWQSELLGNPHLSTGAKLTALTLQHRFTGWRSVDVNLNDIARETGQTPAIVRSHVQRLAQLGALEVQELAA